MGRTCMGQPVGKTVDCKTVGFFLNFGFKRSSRASHALPSLASCLLFMEGKRHKEPSSLQIKVQF